MKVITRKEAKAAGLKRYFTGKPCKHGHIAERLVSKRCCIYCSNEGDRIRYKANSKKAIARARRWQLANPEKYREKHNAASRRYTANHLDRRAAHCALRQANKLNATPTWAKKDVILLIYAKAKATGMQVDHIIPLRNPLVCGLHVEHNLQLLTPEENMRKGNKL